MAESATSTIASSISQALSSATGSASASAAATLKAPPGLKVVGIILAVVSGLLIGSSFVFKKKGLLASQEGGVAGEGVAYLKSWMWWTGMIMMILGEICNFAAYAFVDAIVVTPLGALSVVICAILSSLFLKETLTFFGWVGCFLCIVGSVIIALNGPKENAVSSIKEFQHLFLSPGFIVFGSVVIIASVVIVVVYAPKYGKQHMVWYISVCSLIGGLSVSCTQGLGSAIVTSAMGNNQFKYWFTYFLLIFVTVTLLVEIYYLNVALALFNTAMVTPTYYVMFTTCTLVTSIVLYQGLKASVTDILTVVMGFLVICAGIIILQMSKVDPETLGKLDRRSTILLKASHQNTEMQEKSISGIEDPGMDALRGSFGAVGSIIRARSAKRMSMSSGGGTRRGNSQRDQDLEAAGASRKPSNRLSTHGLEHLPRHQLYDAPMRTMSPYREEEGSLTSPKAHGLGLPISPPRGEISSMIANAGTPRQQTIKFGEDVAHYYPSPGKQGEAVHEHRTRNLDTLYPTSPPPGARLPSMLSVSTSNDNSSTVSTSLTGEESGYNPYTDLTTKLSSGPPKTAPPFSTVYDDPFGGSAKPAPVPRTAALFGHSDSVDSFNSRDSIGSFDAYVVPKNKRRYPGTSSGGGDDSGGEESRRLVDTPPSPPDAQPSEGIRHGGIRLLPTTPSKSPKF